MSKPELFLHGVCDRGGDRFDWDSQAQLLPSLKMLAKPREITSLIPNPCVQIKLAMQWCRYMKQQDLTSQVRIKACGFRP